MGLAAFDVASDLAVFEFAFDVGAGAAGGSEHVVRGKRGAGGAVVVGVDAIARADVAREGDHGVVGGFGDRPIGCAAVVGDFIGDGLVVIGGAARGPCASVFGDAAADRAVGSDVVVCAAAAVAVHLCARDGA